MHFLAFTSQDNGHISPIFFLKVKFLNDNKTCHNLQQKFLINNTFTEIKLVMIQDTKKES